MSEESKNYVQTNESRSDDESTEGILMQQYCGTNYLWKIRCSQEALYPATAKTFEELKNDFIIKFFSLERADTSGLKSLSNDLIRALKRVVKNLSSSENEFFLTVSKEFNDFHSDVMELQITKSREIFNSAQASFRFNKIYKRFLLADLNLDDSVLEFHTKMLQIKSFTSDNISELFISQFKNFIIGYDQQTERALRNYIDRMTQAFKFSFEGYLSKTRANISEYLNGIVAEIRPLLLTIMRLPIEETNTQNRVIIWESIHQEFLDNEPLELGQVVLLSPNRALIVIKLMRSNKILLISILNHITNDFEFLYDDKETVFCQGTTVDNLIVFQNSKFSARFAYLHENQLEFKDEPLDIYSRVREVKCACYLQLTQQVIYIDENRRLGSFSLDINPAMPLNQIPPCEYRSIWISPCHAYIVFLSDHDCSFFNQKLVLLYLNHRSPDFACSRNNMFEIIFLRSQRNIEVFTENIENPEVALVNQETAIVNRIDAELRRTYNLGLGIVRDVFTSHSFEEYERRNMVPK